MSPLRGSVVSNPFRSVLLALSLVVATVPSLAGPFADDMAKCLVRSTTPADKTMLVQWIVVAMTLHPEVKQFSSVTPAQRDTLNRQIGELMISLLTDRCQTESREALKNEGMSTIESSFRVLGQVAAQALFTHPDVVSGMAEFGKAVDGEKMKALIESAK
jgi:hypothetical protein